DLFTARAAGKGSASGAGSNTLSVTPEASDQLSVSEQLSPANPAPGTIERVAGKVGWVGGGTMYLWSPTQTATPGAIVVISDSLKTFAPLVVSADSTGTFSANFTVPDTGGKPDVIVAAATSGGYKGSASSLFILPKPSQAHAGTAASSSSSSASSPYTSGSSSQPPGTTVSSSSASQSTGSSPPSDQTGRLLAVGGIAAVSLFVYGVARVRRGSKR
ncbi:MAG TPA: hypothetical protein VJR06_04165, partial [Nitrososphaerales archaeon]|nr:hypothetical protein [Nitrososphaerales archaeon]